MALAQRDDFQAIVDNTLKYKTVKLVYPFGFGPIKKHLLFGRKAYMYILL